MEVNGSGGRLDRKTSKEKSVKKEVHKRKREIAGSVEPGKPQCGKYDFICPAGRVRSDI